MRWVPNSGLTTIKEIRAALAKKHRVQFEKVFFVRRV
jgi:hypothetical protein